MYLLVVCCLALLLYHNSLNLPTLCTVLIFCVCVRVCVKQICFDLVVRTTLVTSFFDPLLFTHISVCVCVCVCVSLLRTHTHTHTHTTHTHTHTPHTHIHTHTFIFKCIRYSLSLLHYTSQFNQ